MIQLLLDTFASASAFWTMVEALATVVGALFIILQLGRLREESGAQKADAVDWLMGFLGSSRFKVLVRNLDSTIDRLADLYIAAGNRRDSKVDVPSGLWEGLSSIYSDIETVALLVKEKFATKEIVFALFGTTLGRIYVYTSRLLDLPATYDGVRQLIAQEHEAYEFLKEAQQDARVKWREIDRALEALHV
jgi:hypothetical protein